MDEQAKKYLFDASEAIKKIHRFVSGFGFTDYDANELVQSAVERQFEILGEALNRIKKVDEQIPPQIEGFREVISFRNLLAHGYDHVDNVIVWNIIQEDLPQPAQSLDSLFT